MFPQELPMIPCRISQKYLQVFSEIDRLRIEVSTPCWPSLATGWRVNSHFPLSCDNRRLRAAQLRKKRRHRCRFVLCRCWKTLHEPATLARARLGFCHCAFAYVTIECRSQTWKKVHGDEAKNCPIILELFPIPTAAYYSPNYSGIIGTFLTIYTVIVWVCFMLWYILPYSTYYKPMIYYKPTPLFRSKFLYRRLLGKVLAWLCYSYDTFLAVHIQQ